MSALRRPRSVDRQVMSNDEILVLQKVDRITERCALLERRIGKELGCLEIHTARKCGVGLAEYPCCEFVETVDVCWRHDFALGLVRRRLDVTRRRLIGRLGALLIDCPERGGDPVRARDQQFRFPVLLGINRDRSQRIGE